MSYFLVEIWMNDVGQLELHRASRTLGAAQIRLRRSGTVTRMLIAGVSREDGRLVCLVEASSMDAVQRFVRIALLPAARIREISQLTNSPGADAPIAG